MIESQASEALLYADRVVLGGGSSLRVSPALIGLRGADIVSVRELGRDELPAILRVEEAPFTDFGAGLLTPAFINAHTHLALAMLRGLAGVDLRAVNVIERLFFEVEARLEPEDVRAFTRLGALECLLGGTAVAWDHYYHPVAVAEALAEVGLSGVVAPTLQDLGGPGRHAADEQLEATASIALSTRFQQADIHAAVGPHATDTVSDELFRRAHDMAEKLGIPLHFHLAQTFDEYQRSLAKYGVSPVARLHGAGLLGREVRQLLVHCIYVSEADLSLLDPERHVLGYCPSSQLRFCFPADTRRWSQRGLPWILGTDCAASNDTMNLQSELRIAAAHSGWATTFDAANVAFLESPSLQAAADLEARRRHHLAARAADSASSTILSRVWGTPGGLHPGFRAGVIAPGYRAHLLLVDTEHPALWPGLAPLEGMVLGEVAPAIQRMMVSGRWLSAAGAHREALLGSQLYRDAVAEASARLARLLKRAGIP